MYITYNAADNALSPYYQINLLDYYVLIFSYGIMLFFNGLIFIYKIQIEQMEKERIGKIGEKQS